MEVEMPRTQENLVSLEATPYYHRISRFLSGQSFVHQRQRVLDQLQKILDIISIEIYARLHKPNRVKQAAKQQSATPHPFNKEREKRWIGNKKKIMYCEGNTDGTVGGSFYSLLFLTSGLNREKYEPIVAFHETHSLLPEYNKASVNTIIIPPYKPVKFIFNNKILDKFNLLFRIIQKPINLLGYLLVSSFRKRRLLINNGIDLLHLNNSILRNNDWMIAAHMAGIPCITHERGINCYYPFISRFLASKLDAIISISKSVTNILKRNGIKNSNIVTIHNGIDPEKVRSKISEKNILNKLGLRSNVNIIGVLGNIREWKGQEVAIRAMRKIVDKFPNTVCLLIGDTAKQDLYYKHKLQSIIKDLGLESNIIFTGYIKNVSDYLNILQIVLHTSIEPEPFGRVLIEAMSLSKPLIAANDGAIPEIIEHEKSGLTFTPGDHENLAELVIKLMQNKQFAESLGKEGYQRLLDNFHINVNVEKTQLLYDKILSKEMSYQ
jgi:glycosyltransferase involved in cell wall biosynthesis